MNAENLFILNTAVLDDAEAATHKLSELVPNIDRYAHQARRDATEEAVEELLTAVSGLTVLMRQITDGLLHADAHFGEINHHLNSGSPS